MVKCLLSILLALSGSIVFAQEVKLQSKNEPLSELLGRMGVEVSFNNRALSKYIVSVDRRFDNPKAAIDFLLEDKPFICELIGGVYVISAKSDSPRKPKKNEKPQKIKSHVELLETVVKLDEILIYAPLAASKLSPDVGEELAEIVAKGRTARYIPGSVDNMVFNLLRMMPGVRASGEPSEELKVWGSSGGESRMFFDGMALFGMRGFNDNISFVNPYLVREIHLKKGGYSASHGNQTGAILEIRGQEPDTNAFRLKASISTLTANVFGSIPVSKRSSLSIAYRRTFYDLYQSQLFNPYNGRGAYGNNQSNAGKGQNGNQSQQTGELSIIPDYTFSDLNITYCGNTVSGNTYRVAIYGADDRFDFSAEPSNSDKIDATERNRQVAGAISYARQWNNQNKTNFSVAYSLLDNHQQHVILTGKNQRSENTDNLVSELSVRVNHNVVIGSKNQLEAGMEFERYSTRFNGMEYQLCKPTLYLSDRLNFDKLLLEVGLRTDLANKKVNLQPRLSANYSFSEQFTATVSWGIYNQYLAQEPYWVENNHLTQIWNLNPELSSMHTIAGVSYKSKKRLSVVLEGYFKKNDNAIRIIQKEILKSDFYIVGADLFIKQDFRRASVYGSYSLIKTSLTPMELAHEVKLGTIINLSPFTLSANYVYGTGFNTYGLYGGWFGGQGQTATHNALSNNDYNRFDIAANYRLSLKKCTLQAGVSLINLFDIENVKYSYTLQNKKDPVTLFSEAMPFTPMLFFEIIW